MSKSLTIDAARVELLLTELRLPAMRTMTVSSSSSSGIAVISLDLSATLRWPSTIRWRLENAEIIWIGALAPPS